MFDQERRPVRKRRSMRVVKRAGMVVYACGRLVVGLFARDAATVAHNWRLFVGAIATSVGGLSFAADRFCDGNTSVYVACTRPATYYYYPWWAVLLVVMGITLLLLWYVRGADARS